MFTHTLSNIKINARKYHYKKRREKEKSSNQLRFFFSGTFIATSSASSYSLIKLFFLMFFSESRALPQVALKGAAFQFGNSKRSDVVSLWRLSPITTEPKNNPDMTFELSERSLLLPSGSSLT